jgi:hypothetical protein
MNIRAEEWVAEISRRFPLVHTVRAARRRGKTPEEFEGQPKQPGTVPEWLPAGLSLRRHEEVPLPGQSPGGQL